MCSRSRISLPAVYASALLLAASSVPFACPPAFAQTSVAYTWRDTRMVGGGYITGILFHPAQPGVLYCRTDIGGAYRWDAGRRQWLPLLDWIGPDETNLYGIQAIGLDPTDPDRLYLAAGTYTSPKSPNGALLRSSDRGQTFEQIPMPVKMGGNEDGRQSGERLAVDPNHPETLLFGSPLDGLWRSDDRGSTWTHVAGLPVSPESRVGVVSAIFDAHSGKPGTPTPAIFAAVSGSAGGVFQSLDAGLTWTRIAHQPTGLLVTSARLSSDGSLYVSYANAPGPNGMTDGAVWRFEVERKEWKEITPEKPNRAPAPPFGYSIVALDPSHPATVLTATMDRWHGGDEIFRSTDRGKHWRQIANGQPHDASLSPWLRGPDGKDPGVGHWLGSLAVDPFAPGRVLYGTGETMWETGAADAKNKPVPWTVAALGIEETAVLALLSPPAGPPLFSGLGDISGFRQDSLDVSPPQGNLRNPTFSNTTSIAQAALQPETIVRVGQTWGQPHFGGESRDGGSSWKPFAAQPPNARGGSIAVSADGNTLVWSPRNQSPFVSADSGSTWKPSAGAAAHVDLLADKQTAARFYAWDAAAGALSVSDDRGATFHVTHQGLPQGWSARLQLSPEDELWLSSRTGLLHANSAADTFIPIPAVQQVSALGFGRAQQPGAPSTIYLAGTVAGQPGVFRSTDSGASWLRIDDPQHRYGYIGVISGDPKLFGRVYLGTSGRGIPYGDPAPRLQLPGF